MGQWALAGSGGRRTLFLGLCCELPHSTGTTVALRSAPEPGDGITHSTALGMGTAHTQGCWSHSQCFPAQERHSEPIYPCPSWGMQTGRHELCRLLPTPSLRQSITIFFSSPTCGLCPVVCVTKPGTVSELLLVIAELVRTIASLPSHIVYFPL